jgi:hypothetical protein
MSTTTKCGCLTGAEATAISGVLLPSTRAFGHVPLTGEVRKPKWKERAPVALEDANKQPTDQQPRCEIDKFLIAEGECLRPGEVHLDGSLLCARHAELHTFVNRSEAMLGMSFMMDQWLESVDGKADKLRVRRVEQQREEVVKQLRYNHTQIGLIRDELLKNNDGTT